MRYLLLQLAVTDLFKARWSADIHGEWIEALLCEQPHRYRAVLERTRDLMDQHTRDAVVTGYEALIPTLTLPDPDDRHVLAAAIAFTRCRPYRKNDQAWVEQKNGSVVRRLVGYRRFERLAAAAALADLYAAALVRELLPALGQAR